jgi:hypothetical protein
VIAAPSDNRWHLKKEVQLTHILSTVTILVSVVIYVGKIEQRLAILEDREIHAKARDAEMVRLQEQTLLRFQTQLDRIEARQILMLTANGGERNGK